MGHRHFCDVSGVTHAQLSRKSNKESVG